MKRSLCIHLLAIGVASHFLASSAVSEVIQTNAFSTKKIDYTWRHWLQNQIDSHPDVLAAKQQLNAQLSLAEGRTKPLYNPELETEFEKEENSDNYRVGIKQTLDVWGKHSNRRNQAKYLRLAAKQAYAETYQAKLSEALSLLVTYHASKVRYALAQAQEQQINTLFELVKDRQKSGDIGQIDVNFSLSSLAQRLNETAQAIADFKTTETRVWELFLNLPSDKETIPGQLWSVNFDPTAGSDSLKLLNLHPSVLLAEAQWKSYKVAAELARLDTKAEPTLGINTGKDSNEDVIGLTFSMPLNVRNNFSAERRAAAEKALSAEAKFHSVQRKQKYRIQAATNIAQQYQKQFQRWKSLFAKNNTQNQKLLEKQWYTGDLSTSDYLLALQQNMAGALSGIELQEKFQLSIIDWLTATGQVNSYVLPSA